MKWECVSMCVCIFSHQYASQPGSHSECVWGQRNGRTLMPKSITLSKCLSWRTACRSRRCRCQRCCCCCRCQQRQQRHRHWPRRVAALTGDFCSIPWKFWSCVFVEVGICVYLYSKSDLYKINNIYNTNSYWTELLWTMAMTVDAREARTSIGICIEIYTYSQLYTGYLLAKQYFIFYLFFFAALVKLTAKS